MPDWIWGAGLGGIVVVFILGFFLFSRVTGISVSTCDKPLAPLGDQATIDAPAFTTEDVALGNVIDLLSRGDINDANNAFYGPVHNFTHNADPPIRTVNEALAKNLCNAVIKLENDLDVVQSHATSSKLAADTTQVRSYLRDGAAALSFPRPG